MVGNSGPACKFNSIVIFVNYNGWIAVTWNSNTMCEVSKYRIITYLTSAGYSTPNLDSVVGVALKNLTRGGLIEPNEIVT